MNRLPTWLVLAALALAAAACDGDKERPVSGALAPVLAPLDAKVRGLDKKLAELRKKTESGTAQAREEAQKKLQSLEAERDALKKKLEDAKAKSGSAAEAAKDGLSHALDELDRAADRVSDQLK